MHFKYGWHVCGWNSYELAKILLSVWRQCQSRCKFFLMLAISCLCFEGGTYYACFMSMYNNVNLYKKIISLFQKSLQFTGHFIELILKYLNFHARTLFEHSSAWDKDKKPVKFCHQTTVGFVTYGGNETHSGEVHQLIDWIEHDFDAPIMVSHRRLRMCTRSKLFFNGLNNDVRFAVKESINRWKFDVPSVLNMCLDQPWFNFSR